MEILTLADGTQLEGKILPNGDGLIIFVYLYGMSIVQGVTIFSDTSRIRMIRAMNHGNETEYTGFTEMLSVDNEYGNCNIVMRRPVNAS